MRIINVVIYLILMKNVGGGVFPTTIKLWPFTYDSYPRSFSFTYNGTMFVNPVSLSVFRSTLPSAPKL